MLWTAALKLPSPEWETQVRGNMYCASHCGNTTSSANARVIMSVSPFCPAVFPNVVPLGKKKPFPSSCYHHTPMVFSALEICTCVKASQAALPSMAIQSPVLFHRLCPGCRSGLKLQKPLPLWHVLKGGMQEAR